MGRGAWRSIIDTQTMQAHIRHIHTVAMAVKALLLVLLVLLVVLLLLGNRVVSITLPCLQRQCWCKNTGERKGACLLCTHSAVVRGPFCDVQWCVQAW